MKRVTLALLAAAALIAPGVVMAQDAPGMTKKDS